MEMMDLTGQRFGRLTVISEADRAENKARSRRWLCECDCGKQVVVHQRALLIGHTRSCGCLRKEKLIERSTKHNHCYERPYKIYNSMKKRCYNENEPAYRLYGARGIKICDEWMNDRGFENFYDWSMGNGYADNLSIDRIDVNGDYSPSNCRWATDAQQSRNKRNNLYVTRNGETKILKDWCRELNMNYAVMMWRFHKGWSVKRMFSTPTSPYKNEVSEHGRNADI